MAGPFLEKQVNDRVARHHNLNGWEKVPPYYADYTTSKPMSYQNPRDTALLEHRQKSRKQESR
jgi:hypothetical protein